MPNNDAQGRIRIVLIDDNRSFQAALARYFEELSEIALIGMAGSTQEALRLPEALHPDIVLLDLHLPDPMGLKLIEPLRGKWPHVKVIVLTFDDHPEMRAAAMSAGATDFVSKISATDDLLPAIFRATQNSASTGGVQ